MEAGREATTPPNRYRTDFEIHWYLVATPVLHRRAQAPS